MTQLKIGQHGDTFYARVGQGTLALIIFKSLEKVSPNAAFHASWQNQFLSYALTGGPLDCLGLNTDSRSLRSAIKALSSYPAGLGSSTHSLDGAGIEVSCLPHQILPFIPVNDSLVVEFVRQPQELIVLFTGIHSNFWMFKQLTPRGQGLIFLIMVHGLSTCSL
jgi:hypothetical protein